MSCFNDYFEAEAGNDSDNNSDCFKFGLQPGVTSIVFDSLDKEDADTQFKTAEYGQVNNVCVSLNHVVAVINLGNKNKDVHC